MVKKIKIGDSETGLFNNNNIAGTGDRMTAAGDFVNTIRRLLLDGKEKN